MHRLRVKCVMAWIFHAFAFGIFPQAIGQPINIIPYPNVVTTTTGYFTFAAHTVVTYDVRDSSLHAAVEPCFDKIRQLTGLPLPINTQVQAKNMVRVWLTDSIAGEEAYELQVSPATVTLRARAAGGLYYGMQSLMQLLAACSGGGTPAHTTVWQIPALHIRDAPAFGYRGLMLDVARHFMPLEFVKKLVDLMAMKKMNQLQLHLTDDQGWRLEIKKYPKLTAVGAIRYGTQTGRQGGDGNDNLMHKGYYTQQEMRELVAYARERFVNVIPEIEMPGHSSAAIAAYPALSCFPAEASPITPNLSAYALKQYRDSGVKRVAETWGVFPDVLCPTEYTFQVLQEILDEVMDIFPSPFIHIGGDECPKDYWTRSAFCQSLMQAKGLKDAHELQRYFIDRIGRYLNSKGRKFIGWDEILEGGLADNALVMSWRGTAGGTAAAKQGHQVIMSPLDYCYLNLYQSDDPEDSIAWGGLLTLEKVYQYHPVPAGLTSSEAGFIAGVQGNLWTEFVKTPALAEFMIFPRAIALAEVAWTRQKPGFDHFTSRLLAYTKTRAFSGVNYARHLLLPRIDGKFDPEKGGITVSIHGVPGQAALSYRVSPIGKAESFPAAYSGSFFLNTSATVSALAMADSVVVGKASARFTINKATGQRLTLENKPNAQYSTGGVGALNNGLYGSETRFSDQEWLGWQGDDFKSELRFDRPETIGRVEMRFFHHPGSWVYMPSSLTVYTSSNGTDFTALPAVIPPQPNGTGVQPISVNFPPQRVSHVRIVAKNPGPIPKGLPGEGNPAWLFVDEIVMD